MRKIVFPFLAIAAMMVSCSSNEDLAGVTSVTTSTSAKVATYVSENYPDTKIVSTTADGSVVTATLNTGETLSFTKEGSLISYANNYNAGLVADSLIVSDSITTDSLGGHGHKGGHGHGDMNGKGGRGHDGNASDSTKVAGHKPGHDLHFKNEIAIDSLSSAINTYIIDNYSGYTLIHAQVDSICQGAVVEVLVCVTTQEPIKLVFNAVGAYLFKAERIRYTDVPAEVSAAVTANYADFKAKNRAEKFTLADGTVQYKVFIQSKDVRKSVTFNVDGTVCCEK